jgi:NAD-dependent deacetylase
MNITDKLARFFVDLVNNSKHSVALTGAGISTESGIPDYRSPQTGLWETTDMSVVSLEGFLREPENYYSYALKLYPVRGNAKPNSAHKLLCLLERRGLLKGVITQNVDGLHQDAGSETVHELHGSLRQVVCLDCNLLSPMDGAMQKVVSGENPPLCGECGGVLKPNAIPDLAIKNGAKLIIFNIQPTPFDVDADLIVREKAGKFASVAMKIFDREIVDNHS